VTWARDSHWHQNKVFRSPPQRPESAGQFGSDLAVTLQLGPAWVKTAFFQLKTAKSLKVVLNRADLKGATEDVRVAERSFVLAIDQDRLSIRIRKTSDLKIPPQQTSKTFDTTAWNSLTDWLGKWLRCELSPPSDPNADDGVESLLTSFIALSKKRDNLLDFDSELVDLEAPRPAQTWIQVKASKKAD
jgi:hypothetical protein